MEFPSIITSSPNNSSLDLYSFDHTPWLADEDGKYLFVVFISNKDKQVPFWYQKASKRGDGLVRWDYHVVCIQSSFPYPFRPLCCGSYQPSFQLYSGYQRLFRVVHAPIFLRCFATDRRHMKDQTVEDGTVHNLDEYICILGSSKFKDKSAAIQRDKLGVVITEENFEGFFSLI
ncbi:hypothetical protein MKX01_026363 [Papaver californicum]|nr:hypothetical protein MKX01_026363 [Papaver californicum]